MKRLIPFLFCFCLPLILSGKDRSFQQAKDKPNILFIVSEDNGPELGCYGAPVETPHLDELAKQGILFINAYVAQAGCSQSRAAFFTGLYPHQNGQIGLATWKYHMYNPDTPNIPKSLKTAGYTTGIIGKLHVNPEDAFPFDFKAIPGANFARKNMAAYALEAEKFMTESDKPFYLQVNHPDAHAPFIAQVDELPEKPLTGNDVNALPYMVLNSKKLKDATANYYNCIMRLDSYIGDIIDALKRSGKYDNTLIVYIGDHGADILRGKRTSYEGGVRIPMIISWPGMGIKNARLNEFANTIDLYPTFLEAAGLPVPEYLPGKSLMPVLRGEETEWRSHLFTEYHVHSNHNPYPQRTVRNDRYKLIWNPLSGTENPGYEFTLSHHTVKINEEELLKDADPQVRKAYLLMKNPPEYELYDLETDPFEMKNLSEENGYVEILEQLKAELLKWQKQTADPLIDKNIARKLFNVIQKTGTEQPRKVVPYAEFMNPGGISVVELRDVYPTRKDMCNLEPIAQLSGRTLRPLMEKGKAANWNNLAFNQYFRPYSALGGRIKPTHMGYSVRNEKYRYVGWFESDSDSPAVEELYDLGNSGVETKIIIGSNESEFIEKEMKERVIYYKKGNYEKAFH